MAQRGELGGDVREKVLGTIGLREEVADAEEGEIALMIAHDGCAADHDSLVGIAGPHPPADFHAREDGEVQIDQEEIKRPRVKIPFDSLAPIGRLDHLVPLASEDLGDQVAEPIFILNQEERAESVRTHRSLPVTIHRDRDTINVATVPVSNEGYRSRTIDSRPHENVARDGSAGVLDGKQSRGPRGLAATTEVRGDASARRATSWSLRN